MTFAYEHVARSRGQELICDAHQARLVRCLQPPFPGGVVPAAPAPDRHTVTPPATTRSGPGR